MSTQKFQKNKSNIFKNLFKSTDFLHVSLIFLATGGFGPCAPTPLEICESLLPQYKRAVTSAREALEQRNSGRTLASQGDSLESWAKDRLTETQRYMDHSDRHSRDELVAIANEWVTFYGLAKDHKKERMIASLRKIEERQAVVQKLACDPR